MDISLIKDLADLARAGYKPGDVKDLIESLKDTEPKDPEPKDPEPKEPKEPEPKDPEPKEVENAFEKLINKEGN